MTLPNIFHIAGAWAELVAFSPVLSMFDSGEVEIMNEDIPEYDGPAGLIGQFMALFLVAIGAVKRIYATSEENGRKRSILLQTHPPDSLLTAIRILDEQQCILLFMCSLAFQLRTKKLTPLQEEVMMPFGRKPLPISEQSTPQFNLANATYIGLNAKNQTSCPNVFSRCPYTTDQLGKGLRWIQKLKAKDFYKFSHFIRNYDLTSWVKTHETNSVLFFEEIRNKSVFRGTQNVLIH